MMAGVGMNEALSVNRIVLVNVSSLVSEGVINVEFETLFDHSSELDWDVLREGLFCEYDNDGRRTEAVKEADVLTPSV